MNYNIKDKKSIDVAVSSILNGEIIIYPTDTLYGFGVDATNTNSIYNLNTLKNRQQPYSIIVDSVNMLKKYCLFNEKLEDLINQTLPGPFTLICNKIKNSSLSSLVTVDLNTIGIRIPNSKFILNVVRNFGKPIITTSVNANKEKPLNSKNSILKKYNQFSLFYDDSESKKSLGSTIIDCTKSSYQIVRRGDGIINL